MCFMELLKKMGWWAVLYVLVKWTLIGGLGFWLSRYDWFRLEYLLAYPVLVLVIFLVRYFRGSVGKAG